MAARENDEQATVPTDIYQLYHSLNSQANALLSELEAFQSYINKAPSQAHRRSNLLNKFEADVKREAKLLEKYGSQLPKSSFHGTDHPDIEPSPGSNVEPQLHQIRSSNISHLDLIWQAAKRSEGVTAIRKQVRYLPNRRPLLERISNNQNSQARQRAREVVQTGNRGNGANGVRRQDKEQVMVDIIAKHGAKWIKLFTKSQRWLVMDMAKEGLVGLAESEDCQEASDSNSGESKQAASHNREALEDLKLVRMAREFLSASRTTRFNYRHPSIHFYLPKICRGEHKDVDIVLQHLEKIGVVVVPGNCKVAVQDLASTFSRMLSTLPRQQTTSTLNLDCTILIALTSDISHYSRTEITIPPHYEGRDTKKDIEMQLDSEESDALLPQHIYPLLHGHKLVCTAKAASHLRNIVSIMGSQGETKRSNMLLKYADDEYDRRTAESVRRQLRALSSHAIPDDLQVPVEVQEDDRRNGLQSLDEQVMSKLAIKPRLSPLNRSVFFFGWRQNLTTVSLNRVVSEWLRRAIDAALDEIEWEEGREDDIAVDRMFDGPQILICGRERSLLGNDNKTV